MDQRLETYRQAGRKAAQLLVSKQRANGAFVGEDYQIDVYHKIAYGLGIAGLTAEAHKLLDWVKEHDLLPSGELRHFYVGGGRAQVYKDTWMCIGAHRVGRFDVSHPVSDFVMSFQAPCGGFPFDGRDDPLIRSLTTAWTGQTALYTGHLDVAEKAASCLLSMIEQQPDDTKFYFLMTRDGRLVTPEVSPKAGYIDATRRAQIYWEVGIALIFLGKMVQLTGEQQYRDGLDKLWSFKMRCQDDSSAHGNSGKDGYGSAIYYAITGNPRAREEACKFADFLLENQLPNGSWKWENDPDELITYLNWGAEYGVWLYEISATLAAADQQRDALTA